MTTEHFTQVGFENFGPIKKASLKLTRLHALIGPNDSGKSFTLNALANQSTVGVLQRRLVRKIRFDPDELRLPTPLFRDDESLRFSGERGRGLGSILDAIFVRRAQDYLDIEQRLVERFPVIAGLRLFTREGGRVVGIRLKNGVEVEGPGMSEGILYFLAFSALRYLDPVDLLLVEEPENGLHPARIAEVVGILREISKTTQVVMATHSPLVVNELQPDEVTLVTRTPEHGTKFTPIADTPNFKRRSSAFALGELWLAYADGNTEAPLLSEDKTG